MRKSSATKHLFAVRVRQMGNPVIREGFTYDLEGNVTPDDGDNRHMRRFTRAMLRKERKL